MYLQHIILIVKIRTTYQAMLLGQQGHAQIRVNMCKTYNCICICMQRTCMYIVCNCFHNIEDTSRPITWECR